LHQAQIDHCRIAAKVGDFDFPSFNAGAVVESVERDSFVDKSTETEIKRANTLYVVKRFKALTNELLGTGRLRRSQRKTAQRRVATL